MSFLRVSDDARSELSQLDEQEPEVIERHRDEEVRKTCSWSHHWLQTAVWLRDCTNFPAGSISSANSDGSRPDATAPSFQV
jgi:hypothetical protein